MQSNVDRQYYIDWVRVLAFLLLIFFHCAMPFVIFGWEVKNKETSMGLSRLVWWMHQWRLPLLFFISGVGIHFSLRNRRVLAFAGERMIRLFIPLAFAMLFVIPIQVWVEKTQEGLITSSYASFYPTVWSFIPYPDGTLTWSHLWFIVYLLVYCILLLPVFALFKIESLKRAKEKLANVFSHPVWSFLLVLPLIFYYFTLYLKHPEQLNLVDHWFVFVFSLTLLVYGYFLGGSMRFWAACEKYRYWFLSIALVCIVILYYQYWWNMKLPKEQNGRLYAYGVLNSMHIWCLILAILGFAKKHLNFSNRFIRYANQAVYPFYILHQTLIVVMGYFIVEWQIPLMLKLVLLMVLCFGTLAIIYHWLIKPFILMRILYGLKPREKKPSVKNTTVAAQPV